MEQHETVERTPKQSRVSRAKLRNARGSKQNKGMCFGSCVEYTSVGVWTRSMPLMYALIHNMWSSSRWILPIFYILLARSKWQLVLHWSSGRHVVSRALVKRMQRMFVWRGHNKTEPLGFSVPPPHDMCLCEVGIVRPRRVLECTC